MGNQNKSCLFWHKYNTERGRQTDRRVIYNVSVPIQYFFECFSLQTQVTHVIFQCLWHCLINSLPFIVVCVNTVVMKYAALSPWGMNEVCCSTGIYHTHSHFLLLLHIWMWLVNEFTGMFCTWSVLRYMHKESKIVGESASMCSWGH